MKGERTRSGGYLLVNGEGNDLSAEGYALLALLMELVWAVQTTGCKMSAALDRIGARGCLVQRKKQAFNDARRHLDGLLKGLMAAFEGTFDYAMCHVASQAAERTEDIQRVADHIVRLVILFTSRVDTTDPAEAERVLKAVSNFKDRGWFDCEALLSFVKMQ